jgi:Family of unknown function (DUF5331)
MSAMTQLDEIKDLVRQKWLEYYQTNCAWIREVNDYHDSWISTADYGYRPDSFIILAAIAGWIPELSGILPELCDQSANASRLIDKLGLNFDPEKVLFPESEQDEDGK